MAILFGKLSKRQGRRQTIQFWKLGRGPKILTQSLLETGATVLAVEKDGVLAEALGRLATPSNHLQVFCDDILTFPLEKELSGVLEKGKKAKVIANLPYHLTTPIIAQLVRKREFFSSLTVMVQEEVGRRFTALPGTSEYSSFTIFLQFYSFPKFAFSVSRNCFYPAPQVNSAVVHLTLREPPLAGEACQSFFQLTRRAFAHRRKMLRSSLKEFFPPQKIEEVLGAIGENPLARPEDLSLEAFLKLHALLHFGN